MGNKRERSGAFKAIGVMRDGVLEAYADELERYAFADRPTSQGRKRRRRRRAGRALTARAVFTRRGWDEGLDVHKAQVPNLG